VETCQAERGTLAVCIREAQRTLAQSSKRLIEGKIASLGLGRGFKLFNDKIETPGDGLIIFRGMQDHTAESMKSLEGFRIAWIDEAQTLSARSLALLRPTIRAMDSEVWASWNPRRKSDAIDDFLRARKPGGAIVVSANWRDNPWFPAVLEEERQLDLALYPDRYEHIWEGDYVRAFEGAYFAQLLNEARAQGRIGRVAADPLLPLRAFIDIGGAGATADAFTMWIVQWVGTEVCARRPLRSRCSRQPAWLCRLAEGDGGNRSDCGAHIGTICLHHVGSDAKLLALSSVEAHSPLFQQTVEGLDRCVRCFHSHSPLQKEMNHVDFLRSHHVCSRLCVVLVLQG
jgi:phage terminase large subunit